MSEEEKRAERLTEIRKAAQRTRRRVKALTAAREAKGEASNVMLLPTCERIPTVSALAYSLGVATEEFGWTWADVCHAVHHYACTVLLGPDVSRKLRTYLLPQGQRPETILRAALRGFGGRPVTEFDADAYTEAWMQAQAVGGDAEHCFGVMLEAVISEALRKRWLREHPCGGPSEMAS
jgi:hypothetical protein